MAKVAAVLVGQMDEGHLVGHEVAVHVLDVDDYGGGVGDDDADVRRPLVLPDPASVVDVAYVQQHQVLPIAFHNMYDVVERHNPSFGLRLEFLVCVFC